MNGAQHFKDVLSSYGLHLSDYTLSELWKLIGNHVSCDEIVNGVVHHVVRLRGSRCSVILKHRANRCRRIPTAPLNPEDIRYEAQALSLLSPLLPDHLPKLLWFDEEAHTLILSDLATPGLQDGLLFFNSASSKQVAKIGIKIIEAIATLHLRIRGSSFDMPIRPDDDQAFFARNMYERITYHDLDSTTALADALAQLPRHLIVGDFGPKNMLVGHSSFRFCDLEHAHFAPLVFDLSFLLSHIVLHRIALQPPRAIGELIENLVANYNSICSLEQEVVALIAPMIAAIMAYRLRNPVVPYPLPLDESVRQRLASKALESLNTTYAPTGKQVARLLMAAEVK